MRRTVAALTLINRPISDTRVDAGCRNLFYMNSSITRSGRGLVHGRIYKRDGTLAGEPLGSRSDPVPKHRLLTVRRLLRNNSGLRKSPPAHVPSCCPFTDTCLPAFVNDRLKKASFAQRSNRGFVEEVAGLVVSSFLALPNRLTDVVVRDV